MTKKGRNHPLGGVGVIVDALGLAERKGVGVDALWMEDSEHLS